MKAQQTGSISSDAQHFFLDREIDLGVLGKVPLRLTMTPHEGRLEVLDIAARLQGKTVILDGLDLLADALGIHLDPLLLGKGKSP